MSKPYIVCVDEEPARLERLATIIHQRFGETYPLQCYSSSEECVEGLVAMAVGPSSPSLPVVLCDESMQRLIVQLEQHHVRLANVVLIQGGWEDGPLVDAIERLLTQYDQSAAGSAAHRHAVEKKNASLEALHQIGVALASSFDIDSILSQISRAAMLLLGDVRVDVFYAGSRKISSQPRWLPAKPSKGHVARDDRAALERRVAALADDDLGRDSATEVFESRRSDGPIDMGQIIPIAQQENVLGLIVVEPGRSLSQEDLGLLSILSLQAATALHNIHLTQERIHFERLSAVGRMIGSVVHDFRSPLTAVRGYAGMLASLTVSEEHRREYARLIVEECDRLGGLTEELLELTRGSRTKPAIRSVDLADFFRDLEPSLEAQFMDSEVRLRIELGYRGPVALDSDRMTRAILNVAANARQAIDGPGSFAVRSKQDLEHVVLEFEDTGCGIPEDIRHRIFEPFFSYGKAQGIGLGMCIIQRIVQEHGGETVLSSQPGVGTLVKFLLPLERVVEAESSTKADTIEHSTAGMARGRRS